tara:strand:- start:162 stop:365 length:204 start_codon:yes stop_codon:yes gene_type:complete
MKLSEIELDVLAVGNYLLIKEEQEESLRENYEHRYDWTKLMRLSMVIIIIINTAIIFATNALQMFLK